MKILRKILIGIVALIAVVLIAALFVKKDYTVEREIVISKPKAAVFQYISQLKNQDHYSKWVMADPNMKKTFTGTDATAGFIYAWDGNKDAGKGEQEIVKIEPDKRVDMEVRFKKPMESTAQTYMITDDAGNNTTRVKWGFKCAMPYPMNVMRLFINIEDMLGKDMDTSLHTLKNNLEK